MTILKLYLIWVSNISIISLKIRSCLKQGSLTCDLLSLIHAVQHQTFKIFSLPLNVYCEVSLNLPMELVDLHCSENLKSKFHICPILDFHKNLVLPTGQFPNLIILSEHVWFSIPLNNCSPK